MYKGMGNYVVTYALGENRTENKDKKDSSLQGCCTVHQELHTQQYSITCYNTYLQ
jgi:hypothetical protein